MDRIKTGLVLSGGGARSIVHLGVLKALEEEGIVFDKLAGTSAGAVIAALYGGGMNPREILELVIKLRLWSFVTPVIPKTGLLGMSKAEKLLLKNLPVKTFEELKIPVCIAATDVNKGISVCFSKGDLVKPLLASCSIPILFNPVEFEGKSYVDGGVLNNLPADLIRNEVDFLIGVHSNPVDPDFEPSGVKSMIERTFLMAISSNVNAKKDLCDVYIEPDGLKHYKIIDFRKAEEIFEIGYQYTKQNMGSFDLEKLKFQNNDISGADSTGNSAAATKGKEI